MLSSSDPNIKPYSLTYAHTSTDPSERKRCKDEGAEVFDDDGTIYGNRVNG